MKSVSVVTRVQTAWSEEFFELQQGQETFLSLSLSLSFSLSLSLSLSVPQIVMLIFHNFHQPNQDNQFFDVLLTVHLSIFILVINQLDAQNLFYNNFISCLYMFRAPCAHRQEGKIVLYSLWYHHTETSE